MRAPLIVVGFAVVVGAAAQVFAQTTMLRPHIGALEMAAERATAELGACARLAGPVIGDVIVDERWNATASRSLGASGLVIAACVRDALKAHHHGSAALPRGETFVLPIGTPVQVLPPISTLMPLWRAASAFNASPAERAALATALPPDYAVAGWCLVTDRPFARGLEDAWLAGLPPVTAWNDQTDELVAARPHQRDWTRGVAWDGSDLVTTSSDGLCLDAFDPVRAQALFDREGSCWVGTPTDILLDPKVEFPPGAYVQVATDGGRTCAIDDRGALTCCGRKAAGTPPKKPLRQIALAHDFACGLDDAGLASCWGTVTTAPKGAFSKLATGEYGVCGLRRDGTVECWNSTPSPRGTFVDIAVALDPCGIHTDGTLECWGHPSTTLPSKWTHLAVGHRTLCGLRADQTVGCASSNDPMVQVSTVVPEPWTQLAVAGKLGACGLRRDGTIACSDLQRGVIGPQLPAPPTGRFTQITADESRFCAVGASAIACWGESWPPDRTRQVAPTPTAMHGTIVDERGAPISHATVEVHNGSNVSIETTATTAADGTWHASTAQRTMWARFSAPGREVIEHYGDSAAFARPIVLRPAAAVTLDVTCEDNACVPMIEIYGNTVEPHFEHVTGGSYRYAIWSGHRTDVERYGILEFEMPFAAKPQTVHVTLKATGTGHNLLGTVWSRNKSISLDQLTVDVRCANHAERRDQTDDKGHFDVRNLPPLPCELEVSNAYGNSAKVQLTSYADQRLELR